MLTDSYGEAQRAEKLAGDLTTVETEDDDLIIKTDRISSRGRHIRNLKFSDFMESPDELPSSQRHIKCPPKIIKVSGKLYTPSSLGQRTVEIFGYPRNVFFIHDYK